MSVDISNLGGENVEEPLRWSGQGDWRGRKSAQVYQTPEEVAAEMLAEQNRAADKTMLTWGDRKDYRTPQGKPVRIDRRRMKGHLDKSLAYLLIGPYYIQNLKVLDGQGKILDPDKDIPEVMQWRKEKGFPMRQFVKQAFDRHQIDALRRDPFLCVVCRSYSAKDAQDAARHMFKNHRREFFEDLGEPDPGIGVRKDDAAPIPEALSRPPRRPRSTRGPRGPYGPRKKKAEPQPEALQTAG